MKSVNENASRILRRKQVEELTGLSRSTLYKFIKEGLFPQPISLGSRAVGWIGSEVDQWISKRIEISRSLGGCYEQ